MSLQVRVTPRAHKDLKNIGCYTLQAWGKEQRNKYLHALDQRFNWIAENPRIGKHRTDIQEGYYSFPQGSHVIFYLITKTTIDIIGIPHKEMDIINYFDTH